MSEENQHSFYRGKDCIKKFCKELKELGTKIINYEQKEMIPLTSDELAFYKNQKECYKCQKRFCYNKKQEKMFKLCRKVRDHCHYTGKFRGVVHRICNLRYKVPHEIPVKFHNGSRYNYHHIIEEMANEFRGEDFECLAENKEKYISFTVPIKKERNDDTNETITYKIKLIDTFRFMRSSLSNLVDNLCENNIKDCKKCIDKKLENRCRECNKSINDLIDKFPNTYKFCKGDINKFVLLLRKGVYPYEYIDSWDRFNEISLPPKKDSYNELILEDISDKDFEHAQNVFKEYCKDMGDYHDLYVQTDTLLLADVFENFRNKCLEIYWFDSYFYSAPGLAWQACLKKTKVELELLTDIDMLLMVEKGIRGMCQSTYRYANANNKYMKNYNKEIELSYLSYLNANNLYGWAMSQKLPVYGFE